MRINTGACSALVCVLFSGCTMLGSTSAPVVQVDEGSTDPRREYSTTELQVLFGQNQNRELGLGALREEQVVRLRTSKGRTGDADSISTAEVIVGVVTQVDEERVHLRDVVLLRGASSQQGAPVLDKIPYLSRLFVNRGYGVDVTPVPGVLKIPRAEITSAAELSLDQLMALSVTALNASTTAHVPADDDSTTHVLTDVSF